MSTTRIVGVDLARMVALVGMITAHVFALGDRDHLESGWYQLVSGRSAALFAVLAGVAVTLVARHSAASMAAPRVRLAIRALLVALIGLVLGGFDTGLAIILTNYGLLFLLALPVLRWRARSLAVLAIAWGVLTPMLSQLLRPDLPENSYQVPNLASLADPLQLLSELLVTGYYPVFTWGTYLFAGMAVGRLDLRSGRYDIPLMIGGLLGSVAALAVSRSVTGFASVQESLVSGYDRWHPVQTWQQLQTVLPEGMYGTTPTGSWWWLAVWVPHSGSVVDLAHTTGAAIAIIGASLLAVRISGRHARRLWEIASGAGRMTLTLYIAHALVFTLPDDWGWTHSWTAHVAGVLVVGALFAALRWRGPVETAVSEVAKIPSITSHR